MGPDPCGVFWDRGDSEWDSKYRISSAVVLIACRKKSESVCGYQRSLIGGTPPVDGADCEPAVFFRQDGRKVGGAISRLSVATRQDSTAVVWLIGWMP